MGDFGGFAIAPETCIGYHNSGIRIRGRSDGWLLSVETDTPEPLQLLREGEVIFTGEMAPLHGVAFNMIREGDGFWTALVQSDTLTAGGASLEVLDPDYLRAGFEDCRHS